MIYGISLILLGVLSASGLIVQKRPDAKEMIEKLAKYQGYLGVVGALWGAWVLVGAVLSLGRAYMPMAWWATTVAIGVTLLGNGFLLGYGLAMTWVKDEKAKAKAAEAYKKLLPYQTTLGIAAIGLGIWGVIASILFRM